MKINKAVIYQKEEGGVGVLRTAVDEELPVHEIAKKDVPFGMHYIIVNASELPEQKYINAIEVDFAQESDGRGLGVEVYTLCKQAEAEGTFYSYEFDDEPEQELPAHLYEKALAEGLIEAEPENETNE
jgi:hypothetical protein